MSRQLSSKNLKQTLVVNLAFAGATVSFRLSPAFVSFMAAAFVVLISTAFEGGFTGRLEDDAMADGTDTGFLRIVLGV